MDEATLQVTGVQCLLGNDAPSGMTYGQRRFFRIDVAMFVGEQAPVKATDLPQDVRDLLIEWLDPETDDDDDIWDGNIGDGDRGF